MTTSTHKPTSQFCNFYPKIVAIDLHICIIKQNKGYTHYK